MIFRHVQRAALGALLVFATALASTGIVQAARVGVLSNVSAAAVAADFSSHITGHTFTAVDTSTSVPSLAFLNANFDVLLMFEDGTYTNSTAVGTVTAGFANAGHAVVLGTFYEQDRSDGPPANGPHGWGPLEALDPNTSDGAGTPYAPRALNTTALVAHALSAGVTSLTSQKFAGGNEAKPGSIVIGNWNVPNARGHSDPAIAYRITGPACVIHIAIAPDYPTTGVFGVDFGGDFHRVWKNAFDFGSSGCVSASGADPFNIPTLSPVGLLLTAAMIGLLALRQRRRLTRR